jgi:putative Holliday junction resolvase
LRILSLDVGDRRIGMAISDVLGWTAQGIDTLERKNDHEDIEKIKRIFELYKPERIVIGLPRNMNGTLGPQGEKVIKFGDFLKKKINTEIVYWDERLSTVSAHKALIEGDVSRKKRKKHVDRLAAVFILQSYLDYINR